MKMEPHRLSVLETEARRIMAMWATYINAAFSGGEKAQRAINSDMRGHGKYTEGFFNEQMSAFREELRAKLQVKQNG